jgi:hypothetical protein
MGSFVEKLTQTGHSTSRRWGRSPAACSLEIISQISQSVSSVFLSKKTSQQYF